MVWQSPPIEREKLAADFRVRGLLLATLLYQFNIEKHGKLLLTINEQSKANEHDRKFGKTVSC